MRCWAFPFPTTHSLPIGENRSVRPGAWGASHRARTSPGVSALRRTQRLHAPATLPRLAASAIGAAGTGAGRGSRPAGHVRQSGRVPRRNRESRSRSPRSGSTRRLSWQSLKPRLQRTLSRGRIHTRDNEDDASCDDDVDWEKVYEVINRYPVIPAVVSTDWYLLDQIDYAADRLGVRSL